MAVKHNNILHNNHFHKDWQRRVKTWFDQPGRKHRRRVSRQKKAATLGVRPLQLLRPAVRCPTIKYNTRVRVGRGFTLTEIKAAGIPRKEAKGLGIVVDHRRHRRSEESEKINVERLQEYKSRLIVFPKNAKKPKKGDSTGDDLTAATTRAALALPSTYEAEAPREITEEEKEFDAFSTLRKVRAAERGEGKRRKRAEAKAAEEAAAKK